MYYFLNFTYVIIATIDVLVIGVCYGVKDVNIKFTHNLLISVIAGIGTFMAMLLGNFLHNTTNSAIACYIAGILLIFLGIKMIFDFIKKSKKSFYDKFCEEPESLDIDKSGTIDSFEIAILAVILAANNIGLGISAGATNLSFILIPVLSIIFSVIFLSCGLILGKKCKNRNCNFNNLDLISGIILILLGIYTL